MRAYADRDPAKGIRLVTDPPIQRLVEAKLAEVPPTWPPLPAEDEGDDSDIVVVRARLNAGIAVQLLLDRNTGDLFVTTVVAGKCLTVPVERDCANDYFEHPGAYGLLPQLDR